MNREVKCCRWVSESGKVQQAGKKFPIIAKGMLEGVVKCQVNQR